MQLATGPYRERSYIHGQVYGIAVFIPGVIACECGLSVAAPCGIEPVRHPCNGYSPAPSLRQTRHAAGTFRSRALRW